MHLLKRPRQGFPRGFVSQTRTPRTSIPMSQGTRSTAPTKRPTPVAVPLPPSSIGPQEITRKPIVQIARMTRRIVFIWRAWYGPGRPASHLAACAGSKATCVAGAVMRLPSGESDRTLTVTVGA